MLDRPQVAAAIVGARYARHLDKTLEIFRFELDDDDRRMLNAIVAQAGGPKGKVYGLEADRSGRHGRIMKYNLNTTPDDAILAEKTAHG